MVTNNSMEAFNYIEPHLTKMQHKVFRVIEDSDKPLTAIQIAEVLDKRINAVTPRLNELLYDSHKIKIVSNTVEIKGKQKSLYAVRQENDPIAKREKSWKDKYFDLSAEYQQLRIEFEELQNRKMTLDALANEEKNSK